MKLILYYAPSFWFKTYKKILDEVPESEMEVAVENAVVAPLTLVSTWLPAVPVLWSQARMVNPAVTSPLIFVAG